MPLESASYINNLDISNPAATDALAQADDHLRLIKSVLKNTFPNIDGKITATPAQLNDTAQLRTDLSALQGGSVKKAGDTMAGSLTLSAGNVNTQAGKLQEGGAALVPQGAIMLWSGDASAVPAGWALCNGQTVGGVKTPDLRDRFIVGAGGAYLPGQTGGANTASATSSSTGAHGHAASTDAKGGHSHGGAVGMHTLTTAEIPPHSHQQFVGQTYGGSGTGWDVRATSTRNPTTIWTGDAGGGQPHNHAITAEANHTHTVSVSVEGNHAHTVTLDTRSPYLALAFIIKL